DADLAEPVPLQRGLDAVGEPSELTRADAERKEERGDHGGRGEGRVAPDMGEPLEPDDLVGEPGPSRKKEEARGHPVRAPPTICVYRHGVRWHNQAPTGDARANHASCRRA